MFGTSYHRPGTLLTISIEYLYAGLVLQDDVYNYTGNLLLIARGNTLTDNLIGQLKRFNNSKMEIQVSQRLYNTLMETSAPQRARQARLEESIGYADVKNQTRNMLKIAEITSHVPYEQVRDIGELVRERLEITEPGLLFQCINGRNEADEYLYRHSVNVAMINGLMGKWLGMGEEDISSLVILGLLHDVGKTQIPEELMGDELTGEQIEAVKKHTRASYEILKNNNKFSDEICRAALYHHERMNGSGYPEALAVDDIPLYARITAVSDVYDSAISKNSHKSAQSPFLVLKQMKEEQFWGLDIRLVNVFTEYMPKELIGKQVMMSDGRAGVVRHINDMSIEYPIVEIGGEIVSTNSDLYCVSMIIDGQA